MLSTRVFGRLPTTSELSVVRRLKLFDLELWLDSYDENDVRLLGPRLAALGFHVPCVHLPVSGTQGLLDVDSDDLMVRRESIERLERALELAAIVGPRAVVAHVRGVAGDGLERLFESASELGLRVALENDTLAQSSLNDLVRALDLLGSAARGHGVCVDFARVRVDAGVLEALGPRLLWMEVSSRRGAHAHGPPDEHDRALRALVEAAPLSHVAYEVVPVGPPNVPPGEAQVTMLLRQVTAWHLGIGEPVYDGASPFLPIG